MGILLNKAKNYVVNGGMDFWQRGTSFAAIANGAYSADRFQYAKNGTMVHTVLRSTDVPSADFEYSANLNLTTFQNTLTTGNFLNFDQKIEGQILAPLYGKTMVASFWVKASLVGTYPFSLRNSAQNRSFVSTFVVNQANTWEKKTVSIPAITSGTWLRTNGIGAYLTISLASGTTFHAPSLNQWVDGNFMSHASCVNGVQSGATNFFITGIQLEEGTEPSNFERAGGLLPNELLLCQRYYAKTYELDVPPASTGASRLIGRQWMTSHATTQYISMVWNLPAQMRAVPAAVIYNPETGTVGQFRVDANNIAASVQTGTVGSKTVVVAANNVSTTQNQFVTCHITADAEL